MKALEVKNLCKSYPSFHLNNVSFSVEEGTIMGFIGRNGAGKTTTLKSIMNLVHPDSGSISYFGMDFLENEQAIKCRTGYASGVVSYYKKKKIRDIISVTKTFYPSWDDESWKHYSTIFKIDSEKTPEQLSEGMKVKLNIAIALSHKSDLLILDEPTSGLDPVSREELLDIFIQLKKKGVAILFSTHITSDLEKCADAITYIKSGEILSCSSIDEFMSDFHGQGDTLENIMTSLEKEVVVL